MDREPKYGIDDCFVHKQYLTDRFKDKGPVYFHRLYREFAYVKVVKVRKDSVGQFNGRYYFESYDENGRISVEGLEAILDKYYLPCSEDEIRLKRIK
jgi:hypothetical protein